MKTKMQPLSVVTAVFLRVLVIFWSISRQPAIEQGVLARNEPAPTATFQFNQAAAVAKLREQIKGREQERAETVFKKIQNINGVPADSIPAIMEMGYSRSLGVNRTTYHRGEIKPATTLTYT